MLAKSIPRILFAGGFLFAGQKGHLLQLALDLPGAHAHQIFQFAAGLIQPVLRLRQRLAKGVELGLHAAQHLPHLAAALLDGQRLEAHLQKSVVWPGARYLSWMSLPKPRTRLSSSLAANSTAALSAVS